MDGMTPRYVSGICTVAALAAVLAGCGGEDGDPPSNPASTPTKGDSQGPSPSKGDAVTELDDRIALADLPQGPLPRIDVAIGATLIHDGTEMELDVPGGQRRSVSAMGTYEGRPIVEVGGRFFTVADDGTTTPLSEPYESYTYPSRLVPASGHLLTFFSDRGSGRLAITVWDASTGDQLAAMLGDDDRSSLHPADRAVIDVVTGVVNPPRRLLAVSPDGSVAIRIRSGLDAPARLHVGPVGHTDGGTVLAFEGEPGDVVFESDDTFLVSLAERDAMSQPLLFAVVRCTVDGVCERTTEPSEDVTIAGANGVHFSIG